MRHVPSNSSEENRKGTPRGHAGTWPSRAPSDPRSVSGLAHFTEHMCFLRSRAYPKENAYKQDGVLYYHP